MPKKKGQNQGKHASQSFADLVAKASMNVVKPYVHELFADMANNLSMRVFRQLAAIQTRIMAVEELLKTKLGVTEAEIQAMVAQIEDEATGYLVREDGAQPGDLVRLTVRTKEKDKDWSEAVKKQVTRLLNKPYSLGSEVVETAIVGMKTGDTKEVTLEDGFVAEVSIDRVSFKPAPPAPPQPEPAKEGTDESPNA